MVAIFMPVGDVYQHAGCCEKGIQSIAQPHSEHMMSPHPERQQDYSH